MSLIVVFGIGIAVIGIGIGLDFLLPGGTPGLNPPLLIIVGLGMALAAALMRRKRPGSRLISRLIRSIATVAIVTLTSLLLLEMLLSAAGLASYYPSSPADFELSVMPWWVCGDAGCRYD